MYSLVPFPTSYNFLILFSFRIPKETEFSVQASLLSVPHGSLTPLEYLLERAFNGQKLQRF